jgi:hypothetical protein
MRKKSNHTVVIIRHTSAALDEREGASAYFAMCLRSGLDEDEVGTDSEREQRTQKKLDSRHSMRASIASRDHA